MRASKRNVSQVSTPENQINEESKSTQRIQNTQRVHFIDNGFGIPDSSNYQLQAITSRNHRDIYRQNNYQGIQIITLDMINSKF